MIKIYLLFALTGLVFAQPQIIHYDEPVVVEDTHHMPSLKGVVVGINLTGTIRSQVRDWLLKKGVRDFAKNLCEAPVGQPILCFSVDPAVQGGTISGSATSSSPYGSDSGSWSTSRMVAIAHADLIISAGNSKQVGWAAGWKDAGTTSDYGSTSGKNFSSSGGSTITTPANVAAAHAQRMAIMRLVDHYPVLEIGGHTKEWLPGVTAELQKAFPNWSPAPEKTSRKSKKKKEKQSLSEKLADLDAKTH